MSWIVKPFRLFHDESAVLSTPWKKSICPSTCMAKKGGGNEQHFLFIFLTSFLDMPTSKQASNKTTTKNQPVTSSDLVWVRLVNDPIFSFVFNSYTQFAGSTFLITTLHI
mmetsp:Transcript_18534/g.38294  ORF Transcript_18534/g.38294 Transcript_18534/m.38294 type:complete len:110 (+) Transcript_18534:379-708(+)